MKLNSKLLAVALTMALTTLFSTNITAQSSCCGGEKHDKETCTKEHKKDEKVSCGKITTTAETTSGCLPSSCRGAKTKFGEAKVISNLRASLITLKSKMEQSKQPEFEARSYDIHGIVGKSDDESLEIIVKEILLIEKEFANKTIFRTVVFSLPENKAKQIKYLENRLDTLKKYL